MIRTLALLALTSLALTVACSHGNPAPGAVGSATPPATARPTPTATPEPSPTPRPRPEAYPFPSDLEDEANRLLDEVVGVRGTPLKTPVDKFLLTRDQARSFYASDNQVGTSPEQTQPGAPPLDLKQEVYQLLGMAPKPEPGGSPDLQKQQLDNLISLITGFYDPGFNAFYMIDSINGGIFGPLARSTMVHEFTHALQYQENDLQAEAAKRAGNADAMTALLSVMEGDAVNTEIQVMGFSTRSTYRQPVCFTIPAPMRPRTPYVVERELDFWYEDGLCFVQAILAQGKSIASIFSDLPTTTEQILHPEKYLAHEAAVPVSVPSLTGVLPGSWALEGSGVFGEFGLQNVLLTGLRDDRLSVQQAAAGWGGDAWKLYASGDSRLLQLETVWDDQGDAAQFRDALLRSLADRGGQPADASSGVDLLAIGGVKWAITANGDRVSILVSNDEDVLTAALPTP